LLRRPYKQPGCVEEGHQGMALAGSAPFFNTA
jgi:hypothetical protein